MDLTRSCPASFGLLLSRRNLFGRPQQGYGHGCRPPTSTLSVRRPRTLALSQAFRSSVLPTSLQQLPSPVDLTRSPRLPNSVYLAEQAERYEEMVENMKRVASSDQELTVERNLPFSYHLPHDLTRSLAVSLVSQLSLASRSHSLSIHLMALIILWNGLYRAKRKQRNHMARRIRAHFGRKKLWKWNVKFVVIRPTGWHGESGAANWGGHIMVDFRTRAHVHVSTHHVYRTEAAYGVSGNLEPGNPISPFVTFIPVASLSCYRRRCDWGRTARVGSWQSAPAVAERANPQAYKSPLSNARLRHNSRGSVTEPPHNPQDETEAQLVWLSD
ncbi:hypothetical protein EDB89DRAFT_1912934 [Lactarius sanguifluus]|nr:hypothetical protein EDB89DRAFT_1912934 [Lactarius sanguifluus]